jgi:hypothetical protein
VKELGNEEIVRLASLRLKIDQDGADDNVSPADIVALKKGLAHLDAQGFVLLSVASRLIEGKPYTIRSYNPEIICRCRSLAQYMGAPVRKTSDA